MTIASGFLPSILPTYLARSFIRALLSPTAQKTTVCKIDSGCKNGRKARKVGGEAYNREEEKEESQGEKSTKLCIKTAGK